MGAERTRYPRRAIVAVVVKLNPCHGVIAMKAAFIKQPGPPEVITYADLPAPEPSAKQVLVRMKAVAVNPIDTYIRGGLIKAELPNPYIIGADFAGVVERCGPGASRFKVGDRVWGSSQGMAGRQGTFAELLAIDEQWLYPTPAGVDDKLAAAGALVGITAHLGLFARASYKLARFFSSTAAPEASDQAWCKWPKPWGPA